MRARVWALVLWTGATGSGATGCGAPPADPPTAVIRANPASVCLNDDYQTDVWLDASESQPALSLVPVGDDPEGPSLSFEWSFAGAAYEERGRDPSGVEVQVATAGDRPLHVTLRVVNEAGGGATSTHSLPITIPEIRACEAGCAAGSSCFEGVCAPLGACEHDVDCPICWRCDVSRRCLPRELEP
jgi:hypothetical protein